MRPASRGLGERIYMSESNPLRNSNNNEIDCTPIPITINNYIWLYQTPKNLQTASKSLQWPCCLRLSMVDVQRTGLKGCDPGTSLSARRSRITWCTPSWRWISDMVDPQRSIIYRYTYTPLLWVYLFYIPIYIYIWYVLIWFVYVYVYVYDVYIYIYTYYYISNHIPCHICLVVTAMACKSTRLAGRSADKKSRLTRTAGDLLWGYGSKE